MGKLHFILIAFCCFVILVNSAKNYEEYEVIKVAIPNEEKAEFLSRFESHYDFWNAIRVGEETQILVKKGDGIRNVLKENGYDVQTMIANVQSLIDAQIQPLNMKQEGSWWESYHDLDAINAKIDEIVANSDGLATIENIGKSYEGRDMRVVKVCAARLCGLNPGMYIQGGIHAREWISPAVTSWLLNEILFNPDNTAYLFELDWYFLVNVNPDGYAYTWSNDRMWRKTRSPNDDSTCTGTDANRNFEAGFGGIGTSNLPCSDIYHGTQAYSENATQNVRDFIMNNAERLRIQFFNDMHSYSQLILLPYGYTNETSADFDDHMTVAYRANEAIRSTHGLSYTYGPCYEIIYPASGIAVDWAYEVANIKYSVSVELRDEGEHGFLLPADQIIPTAEEMLAMHKVYADQLVVEFSK